MIRFLYPVLILLSGCTATGVQNPTNIVWEIDIDEVEENRSAGEFARLCLSDNSAIDQLAQIAKLDGWQKISKPELEAVGLGELHRSILEIPGGGGRYRETQILLKFASKSEKLIANLMERFNRKNQLVRTECSLYAVGKTHLPICAAVGKLIKRPPDSNQRFKHSNAHYIRWNVTVANKSASVRCEGAGLVEGASPGGKAYVGTTISMIVDQTTRPAIKRKTAAPGNNQDPAR